MMAFTETVGIYFTLLSHSVSVIFSALLQTDGWIEQRGEA